MCSAFSHKIIVAYFPIVCLTQAMAWLLPLILLATSYVVYKTFESTSPKNRMKRLETKAHKLYFTVKSQLEVDLEEQVKQLKNDGMPVRHRQNTEKTLASMKEYLQHIKDVEEKFVRLKERYKNLPVKQQIEIYQDWYEYTVLLKSTENEQRGLSYLLMPEDYLERLKALQAKREAIEERFDRKL